MNEFAEILAIDANDGLEFDQTNNKFNTIKLKKENTGLRLKTIASLDTAKIMIKIDVAYGNALLHTDYKVNFGSPLDPPTAKSRAYSPETVLAEKFEAVVKLGLANSRIKDFYDLYTLPRSLEIDQYALKASIKATFDQRETTIPLERPLGLTQEFAENPIRRN